MKNSFKKIIILFFLMVAPVVMSNVLADDPPSPGGNPAGGTPLDGGVSLLIAASAIYGAKKSKVFNINKKKNNENI
ncbi:MAG: PID-CTERM protein-sorting domain-containing protein [Bacteroidales bacterium]